jgi:RNA polymerase sigma-70 factor (ECF subfamily)
MQNNLQSASQTPVPPFHGEADEELIRLAQSGRAEAFSELTRRNYSVSLRLAISILRDREEAEDEVQNAYWKAFRHIGQFHFDAKFSTWITRIVVNQCLMRLRSVRRANWLYLDEPRSGEERGYAELAGAEPGPESQWGTRELATLLRREIRLIPPLLRRVFELRELEELPMPEVAERLGISVAAAKSRLLRARAALRERLMQHCGLKGAGTLIGADPAAPQGRGIC